MATQLYTLPGFHGSGENHWQTLWEKDNSQVIRIQQTDWDNPVASIWAERVEDYLKQTQKEIVVVAHSLGCLTLAAWAQRSQLKIKAALLVAPPDSSNPLLTPYIKEYDQFNPKALPFKSIVLASSNDPYMDIEKARDLAAIWGSEFVNLGAKGHLNAESNLGSWSEGRAYLDKLLADKKKPASEPIYSSRNRFYMQL